MSRHLNNGQLQAALDGELGLAEQQNLDGCAATGEWQREVQARGQLTAHSLAFLASAPDNLGPTARTALDHFQNEIQIRKETTMFKKLFASSLVRIGLVFALILAVVISIPTTRVLADQLLNLFRIPLWWCQFPRKQPLTNRYPWMASPVR